MSLASFCNKLSSSTFDSEQLSPGSKNESYPQQFEFQNFAWISREFRVAFGRVVKNLLGKKVDQLLH